MMTTPDLERPLAIDIDDHDVPTLRHEAAINDGKVSVKQMRFNHERAANEERRRPVADKDARGKSHQIIAVGFRSLARTMIRP